MRALRLTGWVCTWLILLAVMLSPSAWGQNALKSDFGVVPGQATDYVLVIDNSASVHSPRDQAIIREAAKLFVDLAGSNDRFSLILFGKGARVALSQTFSSEEERAATKGQIEKVIDFTEKFSDLRAALRLLADNKDDLFRPGEAYPAAIVLSDGKLEPEDKDAGKAYQEILALMGTGLNGLAFYTVGFGDSAINEDFLASPKVNGMTLLRDVLAGSGGQFYHAKTPNEIFSIYLEILKKTKGVTDLAIENGAFKVDESVESVTLVIKKQGPDGTVMCKSSDLTLQRPEGKSVGALNAVQAFPAGTGKTRIVWKSDCQNFDVLLLQAPPAGAWHIAQTSEAPLEVLSSVSAHINLRDDVRAEYYIGVPITWTAWLEDDRIPGKSAADYQVLMKLAPDQSLDLAPFTEMRRTDDGLAYEINFRQDLPTEVKPGSYQIQFAAKNRADGNFFRRTPVGVITLRAPFFTFHWPEKSEYAILPQDIPKLPLKVDLLPGVESFPSTALPPEVACEIRLKSSQAEATTAKAVTLQKGGAAAPNTYSAEYALDAPGSYEMTYRIDVAFSNRPNLTLQSETRTVEAKAWEARKDFFRNVGPGAGTYWILPTRPLELPLTVVLNPDKISFPSDAEAPAVLCEIVRVGATNSTDSRQTASLGLKAGSEAPVYEGKFSPPGPGLYKCVYRASVAIPNRQPLQYESDARTVLVRSWHEIACKAGAVLAILAVLFVACRVIRMRRMVISQDGFYEITGASGEPSLSESFHVAGRGMATITGPMSTTQDDPLSSVADVSLYFRAKVRICFKREMFLGAEEGEVTLEGSSGDVRTVSPLTGEIPFESGMTATFVSDNRKYKLTFE